MLLVKGEVKVPVGGDTVGGKQSGVGFSDGGGGGGGGDSSGRGGGED